MIPSIMEATRAFQKPLTYPTRSPWIQVTIGKNNIRRWRYIWKSINTRTCSFILALQRTSLTIKLEWGRFHSDLNTNWETQKTVVTEISVKYYCIKENKSIKHEKFSIQTGILVLRFVFKSHLISHRTFWTFSRCSNFDKNSGSL